MKCLGLSPLFMSALVVSLKFLITLANEFKFLSQQSSQNKKLA